jgi:glycosyltransferase involved in cell wall biosynthesis
MRVLLLSPFAPTISHQHAAADTIAQLAPRLAEKTDLFVYSPQHQATTEPSRPGVNYTILPSAAGSPGSGRDRLGLAPAWLRQAWPRGATREAADLVRRLRPDVIHAEYLQSAEVIAHHRNTVLGLHDITEQVMAESYRAATGPEKAYRLAELLRTRRFERRSIRSAAAVLTLSDADFAVASRYNRHTLLARPGVEVGDPAWSPPVDPSTPRLVFTGAMWRRANGLAAGFLARDVMPLVWRALPAAQLRIVGARPTPDVVALGQADARIVVTGAVPDLRDEMRAAHAVVAPSIVGGGVLMKVVHAMALGCPVITSPGPAASVRGDPTMLFIGSTAEEIAAAVGLAVRTPDEAARRGCLARAHVRETFQWDNTVRAYLDAYEIGSQRCG